MKIEVFAYETNSERSTIFSSFFSISSSRVVEFEIKIDSPISLRGISIFKGNLLALEKALDTAAADANLDRFAPHP